MSRVRGPSQTSLPRMPPAPGKSIGRLFAKPDFDPASFCLKVITNGGREEVDDVARASEMEMGQAELQLHDAVYASEGLSVTASRQLRSAQADVCLLSSRLSEQRSEIGKLIAAPLFSSEASGQAVSANMRRDSSGDYTSTSTSGGGGLLAEKVEGCGFLGDAPGRGLLFDGQLTELDAHPPHQAVRRIHMYLLTDCIVTAVVPQHHPRVVVRNRFDRLFPLDQVAVTAAAPPAPSTRLRLLSFPESRLFDTDNAGVRTAWLHQIDIAKKSRSRSRSQQDVSSSKSPPKQQQDDLGNANEPETPSFESLQEALDELDVFVAERDLGAAVDSLLTIRKEWKQIWAASSSGDQQQDGVFSDSQTTATTNRLRQRQNELVFLLFRELDTSVFRGAFLDARVAVTLLCRIDKAAEATHRLLGHGTTILRNRVLQQANFGSGSSSVVTLSRQLAENVASTGFATIAEFVEVIRGALGSCGFGMPATTVPASDTKIVNATVLASCTAALTAWVGSQTTWLVTQVFNQINDQQAQGANLQTLSDCAEILRRAITNQTVFAGVGLDLWPLAELFLATFTTQAVKQAQAVLIESIKKHLVLSIPVSSQKQNLSSSSPLSALPSSLVSKISQDALTKHFQTCSIPPANRVVQFSEAVLNFSSQLCSVYSTMQHTALTKAVTTVLRAAAEQLATNKQPDRSNDDILASFRFLFGPVLDRIMLQFRKTSKLETRDFVALQKDCYGGNPPPIPASQTLRQHSASPATTSSPKRTVRTQAAGEQQQQQQQQSSPSKSNRSSDRPPTPRRIPDEFV